MSDHGRLSNVEGKNVIQTEQCDERSRMLASQDEDVVVVVKKSVVILVSKVDFAQYLHFKIENTHEAEDENVASSCCRKCLQCFCSPGVQLRFDGEFSLRELSAQLKKQTIIGTKAIVSTLYNAYRLTRLGRIFREVRKYLSFLIQVAFFISSVLSFLQDKTSDEEKKFLLVGMIVSFIAVVLESLNVLYHWYSGCRRIRTCCKSLVKTSQRHNELENSHESTPSELSINSTSTSAEYDDPDYHCFQRTCKSCPKQYAAILDLTHVVMIELIFFPQLIVSIFKFDIEYINDSSGVLKNHWATSFRGLLMSFANTLFTVYISRVLILIGSLVILARAKKYIPIHAENHKLNRAIFHIWFVIYACCQMGIHILMITMIGIRFHQEYLQAAEDHNTTKEHLYYGNLSNNSNETINYSISYNLWYMMAIGYVYPIFSTVMFFITYHYWAQKFVLDFYIRLAEIIRKPDFIDMATLGMREESQQQKKVMFEAFERDADRRHPLLDSEFYAVEFKTKFFLPFTFPVHIIVCCIYTGALISFMVCFFIHLSYSTYWLIFAYISLAFIILVNLYAFIVAVFYILELCLYILLLPCIYLPYIYCIYLIIMAFYFIIEAIIN